MDGVDPLDSIVYGFRLLGYLLAVLVVGFAVAVLGAEAAGSVSAFLGELATLVGVAIILAGLLGMQYKVIADAVARGTNGPEREGLPEGLSLRRVRRTEDSDEENVAESDTAVSSGD
jgi:hypothetical protein